MHRLPLGLAVAAVALSSGCATQLGYGPVVTAPRADAAVIHPSWPGCKGVGLFDGRADAGPPPAGSVPADFTPTTVIWCTESGRVPGRSDERPIRGLERRSSDVGPMLDYLALPSLALGPGAQGACAALAIAPTWLFLLDRHGRWITPKLPTDECGWPRTPPDKGPEPWTRLRYRDTVVCTVHDSSQGSRCR